MATMQLGSAWLGAAVAAVLLLPPGARAELECYAPRTNGFRGDTMLLYDTCEGGTLYGTPRTISALHDKFGFGGFSGVQCVSAPWHPPRPQLPPSLPSLRGVARHLGAAPDQTLPRRGPGHGEHGRSLAHSTVIVASARARAAAAAAVAAVFYSPDPRDMCAVHSTCRSGPK